MTVTRSGRREEQLFPSSDYVSMIQFGQREGQFFPFGNDISFVFAFPFAEINIQILAPAGPFVAIFWTIYHCGKSLGGSRGGADLPILGLVYEFLLLACTFFAGTP